MKKNDKKKKPEEEIKTQEDVREEETEEPCFNPLELLNNPAIKELLGAGKEIFKKEKTDPNVCEISIKAPSEVVLKLFGIHE